MTPEFKVGELVRLKSGGPVLVVCNDTVTAGDEIKVCYWDFANNDFKFKYLCKGCLQPVARE